MDNRKEHSSLRKATMAQKRRVGVTIAGKWYSAREYYELEKNAIEIVKEFRKKEFNDNSGSRGRSVRPVTIGGVTWP